jgi:hypothetical protein
VSNASRSKRHAGAGEAAGTDGSRESLVTALRGALYARGMALAKWQAHRGICGTCITVTPPAGPAQCCKTGGRLLDAFLVKRDAAKEAKAALTPARSAPQGTLF